MRLAAPLIAPRRSGRGGAGGGGAKQWLRGAQNKNGGYGTEPRHVDSSVGMTGWAMLGLEAAGINPLDVRRAGNTPVSYLRRNVAAITSTGDLERTIIALAGAGVEPRDFGGRDLVEELRDRRNRDGSYQQQVNLTAYAILAQRAAKVERSKLAKSAQWLRKDPEQERRLGIGRRGRQRARQHRSRGPGARRRARRQQADQGGGEVAALVPSTGPGAGR